MRSGNPPWTCSLRQGRCWWSSIGMSVGGFLHAEGFNERCSQLIPLLPHHNTLVGDKLTTIHHLIRVHLVPEPLHKAPHVLAEVELLVGIEASPKRQAQVFARHDVDRVLTRIVVGNHRRSAVEGSHRQDQVHLCIDSTQAPGPVAIGNYMPLLPLCNFLLCDFKYRLEMARTYFGVPFTIFILSLYEIQYFTMMGLEISHISTAVWILFPHLGPFKIRWDAWRNIWQTPCKNGTAQGVHPNGVWKTKTKRYSLEDFGNLGMELFFLMITITIKETTKKNILRIHSRDV